MNSKDAFKFPPGVKIRHDLKPGDIGYLTYLHGTLYAQECRWDHTFEAYVAGPLAEFALSHNERQRIWLVEKDGIVAGSIAVVEDTKETAQLRWLLLSPDLRRRGMGRFLMQKAINFCKDCGYRSVFLWTVSTLTPAAGLYQSLGFHITEQKTHKLWGAMLTEQRCDLKL